MNLNISFIYIHLKTKKTKMRKKTSTAVLAMGLTFMFLTGCQEKGIILPASATKTKATTSSVISRALSSTITWVTAPLETVGISNGIKNLVYKDSIGIVGDSVRIEKMIYLVHTGIVLSNPEFYVDGGKVTGVGFSYSNDTLTITTKKKWLKSGEHTIFVYGKTTGSVGDTLQLTLVKADLPMDNHFFGTNVNLPNIGRINVIAP